MLTQKGIERFNESRFKSRKVKGRATSSENRKFFVAVMEGTLGVVKKTLKSFGKKNLLLQAIFKFCTTKCLAFLLKICPSEVFSLLHSISSSSSSPSSKLPNFPNCHNPIDCANQLFVYLQSHFPTQTLKSFRSSENTHMNKIRSAHCNTLHSTFCSTFSSLKLSSSISQLSNSTSSSPD